MRPQELDILLNFKALLGPLVRLHQLFLFGSRARGDAEPDSDMDVLVVLDEPVSRQTRQLVSQCAWEAGFDAGIVIVPIVLSRDQWEYGPERSSLLAMAVQEEGVPV